MHSSRDKIFVYMTLIQKAEQSKYKKIIHGLRWSITQKNNMSALRYSFVLFVLQFIFSFYQDTFFFPVIITSFIQLSVVHSSGEKSIYISA